MAFFCRLRPAVLALLLLAPVPALPQDSAQEEEDKGFITNTLQNLLSGEGTQVSIDGFEGALSSRATMDQLTVADDEGVWLTVRDVVLDWNRSALFAARLDVTEFSAGEIIVSRLPQGEEGAPAPEAGEFRLPSLPVSVSIGEIRADRVELGRTVLGQEAAFEIAGSAQLNGQQGEVDIEANRLDDKRGRFLIAGSYDPESGVLSTNVSLSEEEDGIVSTALNIPDRPSLDLSIEGEGPVSDFDADIRLATGGTERVTGTAGLTSDADGARAYRLDVTGDLAPLLPPGNRDFFEGTTSLAATANQTPEGVLRLEELVLDTEQLNLNGSLTLSPTGWPAAFDLTGRIADDSGAPVTLPGSDTRIAGADLSVQFDASQGDGWQADITVQELANPVAEIEQLRLTGQGTLTQAEDGGLGDLTAALDFAATGLAPRDPALAEATGDEVTGRMELGLSQDQRLTIPSFRLVSASTTLTGGATIDDLGTGFATDLSATLETPDLSRFAALAGQPLSGAAELSINGKVEPLTGAFDLTIAGSGDDLAIGQSQADGLLRGHTELGIDALRDATGITLERLTVDNDALRLTASGRLATEEARLEYTAELRDFARLDPGLEPGAGSASLEGVLRLDEDRRITALSAAGRLSPASPDVPIRLPLGDTVVRLSDGTLDLNATPENGDVRLTATLNDLRHEQGAARRVALTVDGRIDQGARGGLEQALADLRLEAQGISLPDEALTAAIGDSAALVATVDYRPDAPVEIRDITLDGQGYKAEGSATVTLEAPRRADFSLTLAAEDLSRYEPLIGQPLSGSARISASGNAMLEDGTLDMSLDGRTTNLRVGPEFVGDLMAGETTLAAELHREDSLLRVSGLSVENAHLDLGAEGRFDSDSGDFDVALSGTAQDLPLGSPLANTLLAGSTRIDAAASREDGQIRIGRLELDGRNVTLSANGTPQEISFDATLRDVGLVAPDFPGRATATGTIRQREDGVFGVDATGSGPGGTQADVTGTIGPGSQLDLRANGSTVLGLLNPLLSPQRINGIARFDLAIAGSPDPANLTGRISTEGARITAPGLGAALENINADVQLGGGTARVDVTADVAQGGGLRIAGPVSLSAPFAADLEGALNGVVVRRADLYEATLGGRIGIDGALAGGAAITGRLVLDRAEIQVPSSSISGLGDIPDIDHVAPPADVQRTRARAGLLSENGNGGGGGSSGPAYPLDIRLDAPGRIFVRGRGLDAELGGSLRLSGTTADIIPDGQFDLIRGRLDLLTQRFDLTEGSAQLVGSFDPFLRLVARTTKADTEISIIVEGSASEPEVSFESSPELPQEEVLALLIFDRSVENISPFQAVQLASAVATLAGRGGTGIVERLRQNFGLDDFDVTTDDEGNTAVRAGKYISDNVYTDVTVGSDGKTELDLNLDVSKNVTVKAGQSSDGNSSLGIFFEKDY
ncbi:hypothetical protein E0K89_004840 [Aquicoccus sp. SCR17]|nr:hypothetical protein [Carideicomes alvinocaridis]